MKVVGIAYGVVRIRQGVGVKLRIVGSSKLYGGTLSWREKQQEAPVPQPTSYALKAGDRGQSTSVNRLTKTTFGVIYNPETVSPLRSLGRKLGQVILWPSTFDEPVQSGVCVYISSRRHSHDVCFAKDLMEGGVSKQAHPCRHSEISRSGSSMRVEG